MYREILRCNSPNAQTLDESLGSNSCQPNHPAAQQATLTLCHFCSDSSLTSCATSKLATRALNFWKRRSTFSKHSGLTSYSQSQGATTRVFTAAATLELHLDLSISALSNRHVSEDVRRSSTAAGGAPLRLKTQERGLEAEEMPTLPRTLRFVENAGRSL